MNSYVKHLWQYANSNIVLFWCLQDMFLAANFVLYTSVMSLFVLCFQCHFHHYIKCLLYEYEIISACPIILIGGHEDLNLTNVLGAKEVDIQCEHRRSSARKFSYT